MEENANRYTANRLTDEFSAKSWSKHGVNKLFKKLRDTGTVDSQKHNNRFFSDQHFTKK